MKVVLFCGGLGLRVREASEEIPKPMLPIGDRPILWHIMRYYAAFGHKDFILCLGYHADVIRNWFLRYSQPQHNDFVLAGGGRSVEVLPSEIHDWTIACVDTGLHTSIGERLKRVRPHLQGEDMFLANYGDNLTNAPLDRIVDAFKRSKDKTACFLSVRPGLSMHVVDCAAGEGLRPVSSIRGVRDCEVWVNGGYFVFRKDIFDELEHCHEIVPDTFNRLITQNRLVAWRHEGFWASMDTAKEMRQLNEDYAKGNVQWAVWEGR